MNNIMKLADAYAEASFDQGLDRTENDQKPEAARAALEAAVTALEKDAKQLFELREAAAAVLSNEEHAFSGGMRSYAVGSQTWQVYEDLRIAMEAKKDLIERLRLIARKGIADYFNSGQPHSNSITEAADMLEQQAEEMERLTQDRDEWRDSTIAANQNAANETRRREDMQDQRDTWERMFTELQAKLSAMEKQEPAAHRAWFDADNGARWLFTLGPEEEKLDVQWEPLYTAPKVAQPLSKERVKALSSELLSSIDGVHPDDVFWDVWTECFVRAIEAAHNIGGQQP